MKIESSIQLFCGGPGSGRHKGKGSYSKQGLRPKNGEIAHGLLNEDKIVKGTISNVDETDRGNAHVTLNVGDKSYRVSIDRLFPHRPKEVEEEDEFGKVKVWK